MYKEKGNVKKATAASAVIVAHHYEVLADYYKQMGQNVTAKELMAKRIGLGEEQSGAGRLYNQQQEINLIIKKQIDPVRKKYEGTDQLLVVN